MSRRRSITGLILLLLSSLAVAEPKAQDLDWLSGRWSNGETEETWSLPAGGSLLGRSRTVRGGETVFFEFLRVEEEDGTLMYRAMPGGESLTTFRLTESTAQSVLFSNPAHDFPKQIRYRRDGDVLLIEIGDGERSQSWNLQLLPR